MEGQKINDLKGDEMDFLKSFINLYEAMGTNKDAEKKINDIMTKCETEYIEGVKIEEKKKDKNEGVKIEEKKKVKIEEKKKDKNEEDKNEEVKNEEVKNEEKNEEVNNHEDEDGKKKGRSKALIKAQKKYYQKCKALGLTRTEKSRQAQERYRIKNKDKEEVKKKKREYAKKYYDNNREKVLKRKKEIRDDKIKKGIIKGKKTN